MLLRTPVLKRAFMLIELPLVIAHIAILTAMLLRALSRQWTSNVFSFSPTNRR